MTAKDLKNALLQEAVQGKLVPQIASEGNARDLLEEIRKEKLSHGLDFANAKSGKRKSKKEIALAGSNPCDITEEEIPFDIPESWCWCRLGELGDFVRGSGIKRDETTNTGLPCVRYGEMYTTYKIKFSKTKSFTSKDVFEKCHKIHTNDILMALTGENKWDIALAATYEGTEEIAMGGDLCKFTPINCNSLFLVYLINSPYGIEYKRNTSTGDIIVHTSTTKLGNLLIPLPPLSEQKRIVAAIEKFMPLIEEYGKKETELKAINEKIGTLTKKAILHEAVQGKLVPQIAAEGNAKDLLEEIKKEKAKLIKEGKIKKEKPLPEISDDEIPFDIPESWCWCKVEDITIPIGNKNNQIQSKEVLKDGKIPVVSQGQNLIDGYSNETEKAIKDIPVIMFGDHTRNVKYIDFPFIIGADGTKFFKPILCNKYYIYYLITFISLKLRNRGYARHYSLLKEEWLPLPPLVEQKRIVDAIEKLLPLCEKLGEK